MKNNEQLQIAYAESECKFTYDEALTIFKYFFESYAKYRGRDHPRLKTSKLIQILDDMSNDFFTPEDYPPMIDQYFQTEFSKCDYNICHFFSGRVRELRFYEVCL